MTVIPAINCLDRECAETKVREAEKFAEWIHLDVTDGCFTFNKTWGNPDEWKAFNTPLKLEVHLMVEHPAEIIESWLKAGAKRVIVHAETLTADTSKTVNEAAVKYGAEVMLATNPETMIDCLPPYLEGFLGFQVLAVHPGFAGQKFLPLVLDKVKYLRKHMPGALIEIDGGINEETAKLAKDAGANIIVAASHIFGNQEPKKAFETLKAI